MPELLSPSLNMKAECRFTSNGDGAKTSKVSVVARSGDAVNTPWWGPVIHDFAGMDVKSRIPLDYAHDQNDNIGYLNNFDTSSGSLVCSGAIVNTDDIADLLTKMENGVPYEASIQFGEDFILEFVPENVQTQINVGTPQGQSTITGPMTIVRQWSLIAVAICKFGMDSNTSAELQYKKPQESKKGFFAHISNNKNIRENTMSQSKLEKQEQAPAAAVEAKVEAAQAVEAVAKVEATELSKPQVETQKVVEAETPKTEAKVETMAKVEAVDPRAEFKQFVTTFGHEKAAQYFDAGKSFSDSMTLFVKDVQSENEALKKRLSSLNLGAEKPIAFSDGSKHDAVDEKKKGMAAVISRGNAPIKRKR